MFVHELCGCGFESRCSQSFATIKRKEQNYQCDSHEERKSIFVPMPCSIFLNDDLFFLVNETDDNDLDNT